jgi:hypothetical protein
MAGGYRNYLELVLQWSETDPQNTSAEAKVLLGCASRDRWRQLVRAAQYWQFVLAVLYKRGVQLGSRTEEALLAKLWPALLAAGTLTWPQAERCCLVDPVEELLRTIAGEQSVKACKAAIIAERTARQSKQRATRLTLYKLELLGTQTEDNEYDAHQVRVKARRAFSRQLRLSNKRRGIDAEDALARRLGGSRVPGSGAGFEKGDVRLPGGGRIELKLAGRRWNLPLYQLAQVATQSAEPAVVLSDGTGPRYAIVPITDEWAAMAIATQRTLDPDAKHITFSVRYYARLFAEHPDALVRIEWTGNGTWVMGPVALLIGGMA